MLNFDLDPEDEADVIIAMYSVLLNQPPSVIRKESLRDLQFCGLVKEYESKKMEEETKKSQGGKSVVPRGKVKK